MAVVRLLAKKKNHLNKSPIEWICLFGKLFTATSSPEEKKIEKGADIFLRGGGGCSQATYREREQFKKVTDAIKWIRLLGKLFSGGGGGEGGFKPAASRTL